MQPAVFRGKFLGIHGGTRRGTGIFFAGFVRFPFLECAFLAYISLICFCMIIVYTVTSTPEEAENIAKLLLEQQLCACVNMLPGMRSMYLWEGKLEHSLECVLLIKTQEEHYASVEELIKREHSYEVPAIFSWPADRVLPEYEAWLKNALK